MGKQKQIHCFGGFKSIASILVAMLLICTSALAQTITPDVAAELDQAIQAGRAQVAQETAVYNSLNNPQLVETKQRQAQTQSAANLAQTVVQLIGRYPAQGRAIIDRAVQAEPQARDHILSAAQSSYPTLFGTAPAPVAAAPATQIGNWYNQQPLQAVGQAAAPVQYASAQPTYAAAVPISWYSQNNLSAYGAPAYPQPQLPANVPPGPERTNVAQAGAPQPPGTGEARRARRTPGKAVAQPQEIWDPIEPVNRGILYFNDAVDFVLLRPVAKVYSFTPDFIKTGVSNVLFNLRSPVIFFNDVVQLTFKDAAKTFDRFVINSTIGLAGLWDPADKIFRIPKHEADFGQTLHAYGVPYGPYLMAPLLGPTTLRDGVGRIVDAVIDPWSYFLPVYFTYGRIGATVLSTREELLDPLDELQKSSLDWYAGLKSAYRQNRERQLRKEAGAFSAEGAVQNQQEMNDLFDQAQ